MEQQQKVSAVLAFTQCFGHKDFIETKSVLEVLERAWTWLFYHFYNLKTSSLIITYSSLKISETGKMEKQHTSLEGL
jgi:hypothetical protein